MRREREREKERRREEKRDKEKEMRDRGWKNVKKTTLGNEMEMHRVATIVIIFKTSFLSLPFIII